MEIYIKKEIDLDNNQRYNLSNQYLSASLNNRSLNNLINNFNRDYIQT